MLFTKSRRWFSSVENQRINEFYGRHSQKELKDLLEKKRAEVMMKNRINIPGRRTKVIFASGKILDFLTPVFVLFIWTGMKWKEQNIIRDQRRKDLDTFQNVSKPFVQAQNELRENILKRRQDLTAKNVLDEKQYKRYLELLHPFHKNKNVPAFHDR